MVVSLCVLGIDLPTPLLCLILSRQTGNRLSTPGGECKVAPVGFARGNTLGTPNNVPCYLAYLPQGEGARRLRAYVAGKGRDLKRARLESQQWRDRCGAMQRR